MSCPTCDHTMHGIGHGMFHCPRCGTLHTPAVTVEGNVFTPALVERCREFEVAAVATNPVYDVIWHGLGIAEAINPPGKRPACP